MSFPERSDGNLRRLWHQETVSIHPARQCLAYGQFAGRLPDRERDTSDSRINRWALSGFFENLIGGLAAVLT